MLQSCELDPLLTVQETLKLFASFYERPRPIEEVLGLVGLKGKEDQRLGRLSGGQRRRADVAIALVGDPDLIFLDEPTTGFDPTARREAWTMITGLKDLGKTVLLTTHYMEEAQHLADRVAVLRDGRIIADGRGRAVLARRARSEISFPLPAGVTPGGRADRRGARRRRRQHRQRRGGGRSRPTVPADHLAEQEAPPGGHRGPSAHARGRVPRADPRGADPERPRRRPRHQARYTIPGARAAHAPSSSRSPSRSSCSSCSTRSSPRAGTTRATLAATHRAEAYFTAGIAAYAIILQTFTSLAISLTTQRETGQLKRLRGTPMPAWTFIAAQIIRSDHAAAGDASPAAHHRRPALRRARSARPSPASSSTSSSARRRCPRSASP